MNRDLEWLIFSRRSGYERRTRIVYVLKTYAIEESLGSALAFTTVRIYMLRRIELFGQDLGQTCGGLST
jgi:hypothetical protein